MINYMEWGENITGHDKNSDINHTSITYQGKSLLNFFWVGSIADSKTGVWRRFGQEESYGKRVIFVVPLNSWPTKGKFVQLTLSAFRTKFRQHQLRKRYMAVIRDWFRNTHWTYGDVVITISSTQMNIWLDKSTPILLLAALTIIHYIHFGLSQF